MMKTSTLPFAAVLAAALLAPAPAPAADPPPNWPVRPSEAERLFAGSDFTIQEVKDAGAGVTGASRFRVTFSDGTGMRLKWKPVPRRSADGSNNSPRKELAAYALHRLLVEEDEYFVPTVAPYCIPLEQYKVVEASPKPSFDDVSCVLGIIAVWLEDVTVPETVWEPERFGTDPAYAASVSDLNVFGFLVDHRDGRRGNVLMSDLPGAPRYYAVDNGIAFQPFPWNFFVRNWNKLRVPSLRGKTVDRLRAITSADVNSLGVVAEMEVGDDGRLRPVSTGPNMDPGKGVRRQGRRLQAGLTEREIKEVQARLHEILDDVDEGDIQVFR